MDKKTLRDILPDNVLKNLRRNYDYSVNAIALAGSLSVVLLEHFEDLPLSELFSALIVYELACLHSDMDDIVDILEDM